VFFGVSGQAQLVGSNPILSEAGTAAILLESEVEEPACAVYALCFNTVHDQTQILSTAASPDGRRAPDFAVHYTIDGTDPTIASPRYSRPFPATAQLRAAIFVDQQAVAWADSRAKAASTSDKTIMTAEAAAPPHEQLPR
jgi:hypothetical protein